jgi:hypothetical protein
MEDVMPNPSQHREGSNDGGGRPKDAGLILVAAGLLEVLAMSHHPSVAAPGIAQAIEAIGAFSRRAAWIHGVLIGLMLVTVYGLSELALQRGLRRPLVRAGLVGYCAGVIAMMGAALVSGWVVAGLASSTPHSTATDLQINSQLLILCAVVNRACANFGAVAMSAGIGLWSLDLLRDSGIRRAVGVFGCIVCLLAAGALLTGWLHLDVHGMSAVVALQAAWTIAVGALLTSRKV